jgi:hypothetical protein
VVLDFGLLKSGLFPESELTGEGLGSDNQQSVIQSSGTMKYQFNNTPTVFTTEATIVTFVDYVFTNKKIFTVRVMGTHTGTNSSITVKIRLSDGVNNTDIPLPMTSVGESDWWAEGTFTQGSSATKLVAGGNTGGTNLTISSSNCGVNDVTITGGITYSDFNRIIIRCSSSAGTATYISTNIQELTGLV